MNIYFDMDGVLADFDKGVKELCGIEPMDQSIRSEEKTEEMWSAIRKVPHFYYKLDPLEDGMELFRILYNACPEQIQILSAVPKQKRRIHTAEADKRAWCEKYLPDIPVNITLRREKPLFAKPRNILIDDYIANIRHWDQEGGIGILFTTKDEVLEKLKELNVL